MRRAAALTLLALWVSFSWPELVASARDRGSQIALAAALLGALACVAIPPAGRALRWALMRPREGVFVGACTAASAAITAWVQRVPMHGQVVSGDACMYVAQSRPLSHFELAIPLEAPRLAHAAKFLFEGVDGRLHGVFVPGYPLFVALFARWDAFLAAALVTSALLTLSQAALARAAFRDTYVTRLSLLLVMPSYARALETADLLSHAFTGALAAFSIAAALRLRERPSLALSAAMGFCGGWLFSGRMLDGFVLAVVAATALAGPLVRRAVTLRMAAVALACALPFVALVAAQQKAATGSYRRATVLDYADRSDWPRRCLHLGFGKEVGCGVEHPGERASFGPDGYTPDDALRLIRERTGLHGAELYGLAAVTVAGFAGVVAAPTFEALVVALFAVLLTLAYGLFYYGNGIIHGARHVFPATPFTAALIAAALARLARSRDGGSPRWSSEVLEGAMLLSMAALALVAHPPRWRAGVLITEHWQSQRIDLRRLIARERIDRGLVIFPDVHSYLVALDPWRDRGRRVIVHDDRAGEIDARRAHPELPVWLVLRDGRALRARVPPPPPGLQLEFERAWPSLQRPHGLGAAILHTMECCGLESSGERALAVFEADPGDTLDVPFDVITAGTFTLRLDGILAPDSGRYDILIDGDRVMTWEGYAPARRFVRGALTSPRALSAGPHVFTARCLGRAPESAGNGAIFDALVAEPPR